MSSIGVRNRRVGADIQLGDGHLNTKIRESLHVLDLSICGWRRAHDQVGLRANTVNLRAIRLDHLNKILSGRRLRSSGLDGIVIVVQLRVWVGSGSSGECDWNVSLADCVIEDVAAVGAITIV